MAQPGPSAALCASRVHTSFIGFPVDPTAVFGVKGFFFFFFFFLLWHVFVSGLWCVLSLDSSRFRFVDRCGALALSSFGSEA